MAAPKTIKLVNSKGDFVIINEPITPEEGLKNEDQRVIAYRENVAALEFWNSKGFSLPKEK